MLIVCIPLKNAVPFAEIRSNERAAKFRRISVPYLYTHPTAVANESTPFWSVQTKVKILWAAGRKFISKSSPAMAANGRSGLSDEKHDNETSMTKIFYFQFIKL